MPTGFLRRAAAAALLLCATPAAVAVEAWCEACGDWVEEPHESFRHADPATGGPLETEWCDDCEAWVAKPHKRHLFQSPEEEIVVGGGEAGGGTGADGAAPSGDWVAGLLSKFSLWMLALPVGAFVLFLVVVLGSAARGGRPVREAPFPMVRGVPQGVVLAAGRLVCLAQGSGDGGTATGHRAMASRDGRTWIPAFVKRMVGRSLRPDQRRPALQFEADVLRKLEATGAVPRLFVPPDETQAGGETWLYFAMSVAPGRPWPERGGLGRDTRRALSALCEALVRIHQRGIGHYDLKPQNVFWEPKRRLVTLIDFGSAIDHTGELVNPLGAMYPMTLPWVAPAADGRHLADLTPAADAWVFGLLFCEALVGGVHDPDRTKRRWPEKPADRDWFRERLGAEAGPKIAEAVVEGLFALQADRRMALSDFLDVLRGEWGV